MNREDKEIPKVCCWSELTFYFFSLQIIIVVKYSLVWHFLQSMNNQPVERVESCKKDTKILSEDSEISWPSHHSCSKALFFCLAILQTELKESLCHPVWLSRKWSEIAYLFMLSNLWLVTSTILARGGVQHKKFKGMMQILKLKRGNYTVIF